MPIARADITNDSDGALAQATRREIEPASSAQHAEEPLPPATSELAVKKHDDPPPRAGSQGTETAIDNLGSKPARETEIDPRSGGAMEPSPLALSLPPHTPAT